MEEEEQEGGEEEEQEGQQQNPTSVTPFLPLQRSPVPPALKYRHMSSFKETRQQSVDRASRQLIAHLTGIQVGSGGWRGSGALLVSPPLSLAACLRACVPVFMCVFVSLCVCLSLCLPVCVSI
jgi:hypothetical protein